MLLFAKTVCCSFCSPSSWSYLLWLLSRSLAPSNGRTQSETLTSGISAWWEWRGESGQREWNPEGGSSKEDRGNRSLHWSRRGPIVSAVRNEGPEQNTAKTDSLKDAGKTRSTQWIYTVCPTLFDKTCDYTVTWNQPKCRASTSSKSSCESVMAVAAPL